MSHDPADKDIASGAPAFNVEAIPPELSARAQWVCWKQVPRRKPKTGETYLTKVPFDPKTGKAAEADNPATWAMFDEAVAAHAKGGYAGIGYAFAPDDPYVGLDFDKCLADGATLKDWARPHVDRLNTYTEISPSGTGLKLIARAELCRDGNVKRGLGDDKTGAVEMYDDERYFTVTGRVFEGRGTIEDRQPEVDEVHRHFFPPAPKPTARRIISLPPSADDQAVIEKVTRPPKWAQLWSGDAGRYGSASEGVWAMLQRIRAFTGDDAGRIIGIFAQSSLSAGKWSERKDSWRERQVDKLLSTPLRWVYDWSRALNGNGTTRRAKPANGAAIDPAPDFDDGAPSAEQTEAVPTPDELVRQAVDDAKEAEDADPIYDAAPHFAKLDAKTFAKLKAELTAWKADTDVALNFNDLAKAISDEKKRERAERREGRLQAIIAPGAVGAKRLPEICANGRQLRDVTDDALRAFSDANDPPESFMRSAEVVRLRADEKGRHVIDGATEAYMRGRLERSANFVEMNGEGETFITSPPLELCRDFMALNVNVELARLGKPPLPPLEAVVDSPVMREDGTILNEPGYDPATRLYYVPTPDLADLQIPTHPTRADVSDAVGKLKEAIGDFPFVDRASTANGYAALITPFIRSAIPGKVPVALYDKPQPGTGGSLLAEAGGMLATGRDVVMYGAPGDEEEWRKLITTVLQTGPTIAIVDNVESILESDSLARACTCTEWGDRILGTSRQVRLPMRVVWSVTGNNIALGRNLARRCYQIRLDAKVANPAQRSERQFRHPNLIEWIRENRAGLVRAVLILARAWWVAGRPATKSPVMGSFEAWSRMLGGILANAGIHGFLGNLGELNEVANEEAGQWEAFLSAWSEVYGPNPITISRIEQDLPSKPKIRDALPADLSAFVEHEPARGYNTEAWRVGSRFKIRLGKALEKRADMVFGEGLKICRAGKDPHSKVMTWSCLRGVRGVAGSNGTPTGAGTHPVEDDAYVGEAHDGAHGGYASGAITGRTPPATSRTPRNGSSTFDDLTPSERDEIERQAMADVEAS